MKSILFVCLSSLLIAFVQLSQNSENMGSYLLLLVANMILFSFLLKMADFLKTGSFR